MADCDFSPQNSAAVQCCAFTTTACVSKDLQEWLVSTEEALWQLGTLKNGHCAAKQLGFSTRGGHGEPTVTNRQVVLNGSINAKNQ